MCYLDHSHLDNMYKPLYLMHYLLEKFLLLQEAKATRLDGTTVNLSTGDPVFQGDTVETTGAGAIGLVFLDKNNSLIIGGRKMV